MSVLVLAGMAGATISYQDDFSGAAGVATTTVPEISMPGFLPAARLTGLDGNGHLESTTVNANANYRFRIDTAPLTDDTSVTEIKFTTVMRTPINDWIMIGFQQNNANGLTTGTANTGPIVQFNPGGTILLHGGTWGGGNVSLPFLNNYTNSEVITAEMTYHVVDQTMDLAINGSTVANGFALEHEFPVSTLSDPIVSWAQIHMRYQPSAANGGAYIDSFQISTIPEPATFGMIAFSGLAILFIRRKLSM